MVHLLFLLRRSGCCSRWKGIGLQNRSCWFESSQHRTAVDGESMENMLVFQKESMEELLRDSKQAYPKECCGILIGRRDGEKKTADIVIPTENIAEKKQQCTGFFISPTAVMNAEILAEEKGLEIVGFYHSHPDYDAVVSAEDEKYMIAGYSYPIISVRDGICTAVNSYEKKEQTKGIVLKEQCFVADAEY